MTAETQNWKTRRGLSIWIMGHRTSLMSISELWTLVFSPVVLALSVLIGTAAGVAATVALTVVGFDHKMFLLLFSIAPVFINMGSAAQMSVIMYLTHLRNGPGDRRTVVIPSSLTILIACIPATLLIYGLEIWAGGLPQSWLLPAAVTVPVIYDLISDFFHFIVFRYISPSIWGRPHIYPGDQAPAAVSAEQHLVGPQPDPPGLTDRAIEVGNTSVKQSDLHFLEAQGNYLRVVSTAGETLERYRISSAVEQLEECAGLFVHRSYWVAYHAINRVSQIGGKYHVHTETGETIAIASTRQSKVLKTLTQRGIPVQS
jgi:hypothetical protein